LISIYYFEVFIIASHTTMTRDWPHSARHLNTSKNFKEKGELLLNTFVFFHIAEKVLSFSSLSPAFVFC